MGALALFLHAQALLRDLERVKFLLVPINRNPLGAASLVPLGVQIKNVLLNC